MKRRLLAIAIVMAVTIVPTAALATEDSVPDETTTTTEVLRERTLEQLKDRANQLIDRQEGVLGRLRSAIANSAHITVEHAAALSADIAAAADALADLAADVAAATTIPEVWAVIRQIPELHIGNVLAPKTHQVIASDALVAFGAKLDRFADKLEDLIARAEEHGYDVDEAWRMLDEMSGDITEGVRLADPVGETVIGLDAGDWPDPAQATLAAGGHDLRAARLSLRDAFVTGRDIVQFLRDLVADAA